MADEHAVPEEAQEKTHGDKLEHMLEDTLGKGTGSAQDSSDESVERVPAEEPLK